MKNFSVWAVGITTTLTVDYLLGLFAKLIGVPILIHHSSPVTYFRDGDYFEELSSITSFGYAVFLLSTVIGVWAAGAFMHKSFKAGLSKKGIYTFYAWLMASLILCVMGGVLDAAFKNARSTFSFYAEDFIGLLIIVGVSWSCKQWWNGKIKLIDELDALQNTDPSQKSDL